MIFHSVQVLSSSIRLSLCGSYSVRVGPYSAATNHRNGPTPISLTVDSDNAGCSSEKEEAVDYPFSSQVLRLLVHTNLVCLRPCIQFSISCLVYQILFSLCLQEKITLDPQLQQDLSKPDSLDILHDFFVTLSICNTVVVSQRRQAGRKDGTGRQPTKRTQYEAESPDEHALVEVG